jgi:phosphate transport system substrate-binding protein
MRVKVLSAALATLCAQGAFAAADLKLYGGGSTFAASAYGGVEWLTGPNAGTVTSPVYPSVPLSPTRLIDGGAPGSYLKVYSASTTNKPFGFVSNVVPASAIVAGKNYTIKTVGTTSLVAGTAIASGKLYSIRTLGSSTSPVAAAAISPGKLYTINNLGASGSPVAGTAISPGKLYTIATVGAIATPVAASAIAAGKLYTIATVGTTNWAEVGVPVGATPAVGLTFTASASGTGTGTATEYSTNWEAVGAVLSGRIPTAGVTFTASASGTGTGTAIEYSTNWEVVGAVPSGRTPTAGVTFTASASGTGTGTATEYSTNWAAVGAVQSGITPVVGVTFTASARGTGAGTVTAYATNWASVGLPAGVTPVAGATFDATAAGTGLSNGSANLNVRPELSYCQTGSGGGKNVFIGVKTADFVSNSGSTSGLSCGDFTVGAAGGFGAPSGRRDADFVGTDSPLSTAEYSQYKTNKGATRGVPVQIPAVAGAIGIVYNNVNTRKSLGSAPVPITMEDVCNIWSGVITNWSAFGYPSKAIKLVYRSDKSGTSFAFSNGLSAMCPGENVVGFTTQETFGSAFPSATVPSGAIGASGNAGVMDAVADNDGSIGYGDVNDALARQRITPTLNDLNFFAISPKRGINPLTSKLYIAKSPLKVGKALQLPKDSVVFDKTFQAGTNDATGRPTLASVSGIPSSRVNCLALVDPDAYGSAPKKTNGEYSIYPFQAISYLLFNSNGNGDNALNLQQLIGSFYGAGTQPAIKATTTSISSDAGFSYISGYIPTTQIKNCIGF